MARSTKSRAEEQFFATQKKLKRVLNEKEQAQLEKTTHVAGLRALRLAKEAVDRQATLDKAAAKTKTPAAKRSDPTA